MTATGESEPHGSKATRFKEALHHFRELADRDSETAKIFMDALLKSYNEKVGSRPPENSLEYAQWVQRGASGLRAEDHRPSYNCILFN